MRVDLIGKDLDKLPAKKGCARCEALDQIVKVFEDAIFDVTKSLYKARAERDVLRERLNG